MNMAIKRFLKPRTHHFGNPSYNSSGRNRAIKVPLQKTSKDIYHTKGKMSMSFLLSHFSQRVSIVVVATLEEGGGETNWAIQEWKVYSGDPLGLVCSGDPLGFFKCMSIRFCYTLCNFCVLLLNFLSIFGICILFLLAMRTKGKAKIRPTISETVCSNNPHISNQVEPSLSVDTCLHATAVTVPPNEQQYVCIDAQLNTNFRGESSRVEKDFVTTSMPESSGQGALLQLPASAIRMLPECGLSTVPAAYSGPLTLDFTVGAIWPHTEAVRVTQANVTNANGKRSVDVSSHKVSHQNAPLKRRRQEFIANNASQLSPTIGQRVQPLDSDTPTNVAVASTKRKRQGQTLAPIWCHENVALKRRCRRIASCGPQMLQPTGLQTHALTSDISSTLPHVLVDATNPLPAPIGPSSCGATDDASVDLIQPTYAAPQDETMHPHTSGPPTEYKGFGPCNCVCSYCHAKFWYEERLAASTRRTGPLYHHCCRGGKLLDHNNALVQLFRTARDKLQDADVPEFKLRLFNVVGSVQHELPTADTIGAIVFDSGPETEADFDIVVEAHSGDPQRISRLYPCYMALHFPLLFIYGEQGYHADLRLVDVQTSDRDSDKRILMADAQAQSSTPLSQQEQDILQKQNEDRARAKGKQVVVEQEIIDIMNLKPEDLGKPLDLKVYRKWISKNIPDPSPTGICFMLLDKQGGAIQATGQLPDMRQLDTRLQLDGCYRIQGYGCKRTDNWQRTLDNKVTLLFGRYTQAAPIQDEGFPKHYFNFAAYNEVCQRADTREPILTGSGNVVMLTLWNELATGFPITRLEEMEQPVIIAASSCWAKRHAGVIQLSSIPATAIYINPEVPQADYIEQVYKELMGSAPVTQLPLIEGANVEQERPTQILNLRMIMEAASRNITQQHYTTDAVIIKIDESKGWYFNRCRGCGNPIEEHMPHLHCHEPGTHPSPNYSHSQYTHFFNKAFSHSYCFRATIADVTGSVVLACYSPAAHSLVPNITEVLSYVPDRDPYTLPPIIKDLENTKRRFRIHVGKGTETTPSSTPIRETTGHQEATEITPGSSSPPPRAPTSGETILRITGPESDEPAEHVGTSQASDQPTARRQLFTEPDEQETAENIKKARHD
ncbi:nucleic acid-binding, OB-fold protein [Artemisia annua]|uniref:Nucleic acid-binding, OB-fold protein n=1 Tax=Artemisia annua TaxID=35608 RepID=A0A2U1M8U0_ARTAN|nr:nucleic acid-binding, OB-fold protein [Artemisia annua]